MLDTASESWLGEWSIGHDTGGDSRAEASGTCPAGWRAGSYDAMATARHADG